MSVLLALALLFQNGERPRPFTIEIVDEQTGRGVPLVELRTVNNLLYVTDSAGRVAFDEPGLLGREVFFSIQSFGYEYPVDGFGFRGKAVKTMPGDSTTLKIKRRNTAERIYRVTGQGIYRDTILSGKEAPLREPLLNGRVMGQDSVLCVNYGGKLHWFWGDTNRPNYPLGNYHTPGATSLLPSRGGLEPEVGVDLLYWLDPNGFVRPTAKLPPDNHPTWLSGLTVVKDENGRERMFALYEKVFTTMKTESRGLVEWDEAKKEFLPVAEFPLDAPAYPHGHPFHHTINGVEYVYFATPFPWTRVRATASAVRDLSRYESYTPFVTGDRGKPNRVDRDASGRILYGWKRATALADPSELKRLYERKALEFAELLVPFRDTYSSRAVIVHGGSVAWNPYRGRWIMIFVENDGQSKLGEVWFAEADTPVGPWLYARKIVTHFNGGLDYSFYNPRHHPELDKEGGKTIFFEGTYTATFSSNNNPTPRYDYNQIMYKLDLSHPTLNLPVAIYSGGSSLHFGPFGSGGQSHPEKRGRAIPFFAFEKPAKDMIPVYEVSTPGGGLMLRPRGGPGDPIFYALPFDSNIVYGSSTPLLEFAHSDGIHFAYSTEPSINAPEYHRTGRVVCSVWKNPTSLLFPSN